MAAMRERSVSSSLRSRLATAALAVAGLGGLADPVDVAAQVRPTAVTPPAPATASSAPSTPDQIRARAAHIKEARALLDDPEPSVRLAAFDDLTGSNDPVLQELAYQVGFSSADGALRALALRRRLSHMATFTVEITEIVSDPKRAERSVPGLERYVKSLSWLILAADERNGTFVIGDRKLGAAELSRVDASVTVSGLTVTINDPSGPTHCRGAMRLDDTNVLVGQMTCRDLVPGENNTVTAKIRARVT